MHILQAIPTNYLDEVNQFKDLGIQQFSIRFTTENAMEVQQILKKYGRY